MHKETPEQFIARWFTAAKPVPEDFLNKETLMESNHLGFTILHMAARMGQLKDVPKEFLSEDYIMLSDARGKSVMACAAEGGYIDQVPKDLITENNLTDYGDPPVIHCLAAQGDLDKIPKELLNEKVLKTKDKNNDTPLHYAAQNDQIQRFPKEFLTEEALFETNKQEYSALDYCYLHADIHCLPEKYISEDFIMHLGVQKRHLSKIIEQCYTKKDFSILERCIKDFSEKSLKTIMLDYCMDPHECAKKVLTEKKIIKDLKQGVKNEDPITI